MNIDLSGRVVLVTGASRGIGRALAQGMAGAGATVGVHYRKSREQAEALAEEVGHGARALQADLAAIDETKRLFDETLEAFGQLDVLVNNAGVWLEMPLEASDEAWAAEWERTMAVNLRAPELLSRLAIRHFRSRGAEGRIINVASRAAFRGDDPEYMAYAASKGGLVALTRSIARGLGREGIRAFTLAPGFVHTGMTEDHLAEHGDQVRANIALERLTEPEDLAPLAVLLASGHADHATGTAIDVNAGSYVR